MKAAWKVPSGGWGSMVGVLAIGWGWLALGAWAGSAQAQQARPDGLRVEYKTTGILPGAGPDERAVTVFQRITLDDAGTRLLYDERDANGKETKRVLLRTDGPKPLIYELLEGKKYREYTGDLNEVQKERRIAEENELVLVDQLPKKDREAYFKENPHLRPGGKREVVVTRSEGKEVLGQECYKLLVTENGRSIIDGLVTKKALGSGGPFQLYRRLGAFSDEVLEKLEGTDGILLRGRLTVVTALRANELEVEAQKLERIPLDPALFDVTGYTRVEDDAKNAVCAMCGRKLPDPKKPGGKLFADGKWFLFCSEEHAQAYRAELLKPKK